MADRRFYYIEMFSIEMRLGVWRLFLVAVIANVAFGRIWENVDRSKKMIVRSTRFVPKVKYKVCLLDPQRGPCRANIVMHFFDPTTMNCSKFEWGGCQGNGNRFDTADECLDYCVSKPGARRPRPHWCQLSFDYGFCFGDIKRFYYDSLWQVCKETIYSGCGGNKNNFYSKVQCESICNLGKGTTHHAEGTRDRGFKTVIIVNPPNTTPPRGRFQAGKNSTFGTFIRKVVNASGVFYVPYTG